MAAALIALLVLAGCATLLGPRFYDAYTLLNDVAAGASRPDDGVSLPARKALVWHEAGQSGMGDLYLPIGTAKGRLVVVPGLAVEGKAHPLLVAFAESFARAGFAVLVPDLENLRALRASPEDARAIAAAASFFARAEAGGAPPAKVAVAAISYAAGPAILAALEPEGRASVGLIVAIGPYADTVETITYVTTGYARDAETGAWVKGAPNVYGRWAFLAANAGYVMNLGDRSRLLAIADRKWSDPDADVGDLTAMLGPEARAIFTLLENADPDAVPVLIAKLPGAVQRNLDALNLARRDLSALDCDVVLIHGEDDSIIPAAQSRRLAALLPPGRAHLAIVDHLMHVEFQQGLSLRDGWTLLDAGATIIRYRDQPEPLATP